MAKYAQLVATGLPSGAPVTIKQNGKQVSNLFPAADATAPDNRARTGTRSGALSPATFVPNGTYSVEWSGGSTSVTVSGAAGLPPAVPFDMATQAELDASGAGLAGAYRPISANVKAAPYNAAGDNATDDSAAFQAALNAVSALADSFSRGTVVVPRGLYRLTGITIPSNVCIESEHAVFVNKAGATGPMFTFAGNYSGIRNGYLAGAAVTGASAITVNTGAFHNFIDDCRFDNWDGRAVYDQGLATRIRDLFAQNCLLGANSLAGYAGVVELAGTDAWLGDSEMTASRYSARGMSTPKFACALAVTGANNMVRSVIAETSDHGVYVGSGATQSQFVGVRAELNYGHGWVIVGGGGEMVACHALRNSQAGNNLYDGFNVSQPTQFVGRALYSESGGTSPKQNNGLSDTGGSNSIFSSWDIKSVGDNRARFAGNSGNTGWVLPDNPTQNMDPGAVPFGGFQSLKANNASAQTVTAFSAMVNGQRLLIKGDGFTTLANGANIATLSGSNLLLAAGTWYEFLVIANVLTQIR